MEEDVQKDQFDEEENVQEEEEQPMHEHLISANSKEAQHLMAESKKG